MKNKVFRLSIFIIPLIIVLIFIGNNIFSGCKEFNNKKVTTSIPEFIKLNQDKPLSYLIDSLKINTDCLKVIIIKKKYELSIWYNTLKLKNYIIVLGGNPTDDKLRQGDECTPEGIFHIKDKYPHKSWAKFIWIDYPNKDSWKKHNDAKKNGKIPKNASIGGDVGIHGVPEGYDYYIDSCINWTLGCIALKRADINEIYPIFSKKTVIEIRKQ